MNRQLEKAWQDYYSFEAKAAGKPSATCGFSLVLRDLLVKSGALLPSSRIIDIGCGTGRVSFPLSEVCSRVHGIDANAACVETAIALIGNKENISFERRSWLKLDVSASPEYDLALACMCPFIRNADDIRKLESLSSSKCAVVTVRPGSSNPLMAKALHRLPIKTNEGIVLQEHAVTELLKQAGRQCSIEHFDVSNSTTQSVEEFIQRETLHMRALGVDDSISIPVLETCAAEHAQDGAIEIKSTTFYSLITWSTF